MDVATKPVVWVGRSRDDLAGFPADAQRAIGFALWQAQRGRKDPSAKPLTGFGGASVLEIVDETDGDAFRAVYTVRFAEAVYVLHCFQKKSTRGIATARRDLATIKQRLAEAQAIHEAWMRRQQGERP